MTDSKPESLSDALKRVPKDMIEVDKNLLLKLINSLPKCEHCENYVATYEWPHRNECDKCTYRYGRDYRAKIQERSVRELPYATPMRDILEIISQACEGPVLGMLNDQA